MQYMSSYMDRNCVYLLKLSIGGSTQGLYINTSDLDKPPRQEVAIAQKDG